MWDFDLDFPRERAIEAVNRATPELQSFESRWFGPGGQVVHVGISINRVVFFGRRLVLGVARDIGEHKRVEAELARHRDDLEGAVVVRTAELARAVQAHADSELRLQALNEQLKSLQAEGSNVEVIVYGGARHSFDNPGKYRLAMGQYPVGEHAASRDKAKERIDRFVASYLR